MDSPRSQEEMPVGLMMRMAHDTRAMDGFFSMPHDRQQQMLDYIRCAPTGDAAKSRIEEAIGALQDGSEFSQFSHVDRM